MQVKKFNVVLGKKYSVKDEEKTFWANIGTITEFHKDDGTVSRMLELNDRNEKYSIFPQDARKSRDGVDEPARANRSESKSEDIEYPEDEVNSEDIPY